MSRRDGRSFAASRAPRNPCRHLDRRRGGEVREASRGEAIARAAETPHILLNAPLVGQRLGYPDLSGLDLLELFAFVHPARFAVPTVAGLCRALGLEPPASEARSRGSAAGDCRGAAGRRSSDADWPEREGAWTVNATLHRLGWGWAPLVAARLRAARARRADAVLAAARSGRKPPSGRRRARSWSIRPATREAQARRADRRGRRAARGPAGDGGGGRRRCSRRGRPKDEPNMLLAEAGTGIGKTLAYLAPASLWAERVGRDGVGVDLHQGAAAAARRGRGAAVRRPGGAGAADRRPQGPRELSVPAQPRGRAAGRVRRAGGDPRAAGRALGGLLQGRRHGRRRPARLAAEPVPPGRSDGADRPARRVRLCRLPALPPLLHRARRAGRARGRHRHRQPCAGDGQCRARAREDAPTRILFDEGHHLFDAADSTFAVAFGGQEAIEMRRWIVGPEGKLARAAARAGGAADGRRLLRRGGRAGARGGGRGGAGAAVGRLAAAAGGGRPVRAGRGAARARCAARSTRGPRRRRRATGWRPSWPSPTARWSPRRPRRWRRWKRCRSRWRRLAGGWRRCSRMRPTGSTAQARARVEGAIRGLVVAARDAGRVDRLARRGSAARPIPISSTGWRSSASRAANMTSRSIAAGSTRRGRWPARCWSRRMACW